MSATSLAEVTPEEADHPKDRKRWRWTRRTPRVQEAPAPQERPEGAPPGQAAPSAPEIGLEVHAEQAAIEEAPGAEVPVAEASAAEMPAAEALSVDVREADLRTVEAPTPEPRAAEIEPPSLPPAPPPPEPAAEATDRLTEEATAASAAPTPDPEPEPAPRFRFRRRAKTLQPEAPRQDLRQDGQVRDPGRYSLPVAPLDLTPPKTYLPPPPRTARVAPPVQMTPESGEETKTIETPAALDGPGVVLEHGESPLEFMSRQAADFVPQSETLPEPVMPPVEEAETKKGLFKRGKKPKVKVSKGFEYVVPPRGAKKGQQSTSTAGTGPERRREIKCPRCGQASPRGLCEACEDALSQLRQLTTAFLDE